MRFQWFYNGSIRGLNNSNFDDCNNQNMNAEILNKDDEINMENHIDNNINNNIEKLTPVKTNKSW